jgi:hypothetical protein
MQNRLNTLTETSIELNKEISLSIDYAGKDIAQYIEKVEKNEMDQITLEKQVSGIYLKKRSTTKSESNCSSKFREYLDTNDGNEEQSIQMGHKCPEIIMPLEILEKSEEELKISNYSAPLTPSRLRHHFEAESNVEETMLNECCEKLKVELPQRIQSFKIKDEETRALNSSVPETQEEVREAEDLVAILPVLQTEKDASKLLLSDSPVPDSDTSAVTSPSSSTGCESKSPLNETFLAFESEESNGTPTLRNKIAAYLSKYFPKRKIEENQLSEMVGKGIMSGQSFQQQEANDSYPKLPEEKVRVRRHQRSDSINENLPKSSMESHDTHSQTRTRNSRTNSSSGLHKSGSDVSLVEKYGRRESVVGRGAQATVRLVVIFLNRRINEKKMQNGLQSK